VVAAEDELAVEVEELAEVAEVELVVFCFAEVFGFLFLFFVFAYSWRSNFVV
jgi:hypothetical protein